MKKPNTLAQIASYLFKPEKFTMRTVQEYGFVVLGALIQAIGLRMFPIPAQLVSGGLSGLAQIINDYTKWPIGMMVLIGNIPLFLLGWRYLGAARFAKRTALSVLLFSLFTDLLYFINPIISVQGDLFIESLFGGIIMGIGLGLVYRGQGTSGGSDILGRILNHKFGISISQAYLMTDTLVVLAGGFTFGWSKALYGLVAIYVSGIAAEAAAEGSSIYRDVMIITENPGRVKQDIMVDMERGVTVLEGTGGWTGSDRPVLYTVVTRAEVNMLKEIVRVADPDAFMVIGQANEALGEGFKPLIND